MRWIILVGMVALSGGAAALWRGNAVFDHPEHARLFVSCSSCHAGITQQGAATYPSRADCRTCHDGEIREVTDWTPPIAPPRTNLSFAHERHARAAADAGTGDVRCPDCHTPTGAAWMTVELATAPKCLSCHGLDEHLAAPDSTCSVCHVRLPDAERLSASDIAGFETPPSHRDDGFAGRAHGGLAWPESATGDGDIAASCTICHAREFCTTCHVDAPVQPAVQRLRSDPRSLAIEASLHVPGDHAAPEFVERHGPLARDPVACRTCHTSESCRVCHLGQPRVTTGLLSTGPDRATGARTKRDRPVSHTPAFVDGRHGGPAAARPQTCAGCHVRSTCLDCHRPSPNGSSAYHPGDYLTRHPSGAYMRETTCADCHNPARFCAACHQQAGLVAQRSLAGGYHDARPSFVAGHGEAARQSLESCVSCHTETDCLACHSATGGRRFNPHGPGFDAERLRRRNSEMCTVCHRFGPPDPG